MVELKSGETYNGMLVNCDAWMNVNLKDVIVTSPVTSHYIISFVNFIDR
jgi:small nuclear ribonucleoprotein (snRNP)-like protein